MTQLAVLLAVTAAVPLLGLWVWAVVRTGDRNTPQPGYATGGVIDPAISPEDVADFYRRIDELPTQPPEWVKGALHGVVLTDADLERLRRKAGQ